MKKFVYIEVDTNDGDYVGELSPITDSQIDELKTIISKMPKDGNSIRYETGDCGDDNMDDNTYNYISSDEKDVLGEFTPYCEYGFHTIHKIRIVSELETIL